MTKLYRNCRYDLPLHFALLLTNWLPDNVIFLRLRGWLASHFLGLCGSDLRLGRNVSFYNPSRVTVGNNVYIACGCWFMAGEQIDIGDEVIFGPYCVVVSSNHTRHQQSFRYGITNSIPIHIGRGTWIAAHVTVTAGAEIGSGTLIAANSVVRGRIPANVLAAGQPAHVTRHYGD